MRSFVFEEETLTAYGDIPEQEGSTMPHTTLISITSHCDGCPGKVCLVLAISARAYVVSSRLVAYISKLLFLYDSYDVEFFYTFR